MDAERQFRTVMCTYLALLLVGGGLVLLLGATSGMSRYIYFTIDIPGFGVLMGLIAVLAVLAGRRSYGVLDRISAIALGRIKPGMLAGAVLLATVAGTHLIYHGYAFSMDELMTRLQGEVFASGRFVGEVPPEWRPFGAALFSFVYYDQLSGAIVSMYRPGMALLYAMFETVGLGAYVSAVMTAGSVILTAAIAWRIWPDSDEPAIIAALLVATSQQALAAGLTSYAMSAHLFFNLFWLWLFLGNTRWGHALAPFVGVFTAALHQVHVHAFFALPFLLTFLRPFRPGLILYYGAIYLVGHLLLLQWGDAVSVSRAAPEADQAVMGLMQHIARLFDVPTISDIGTVLANLVRFLAWQSLALVPLLLLLSKRRDWSPVLMLLAASIAVSLVPYPLLMPDQGHGWGYRYLHGLIGNFALLGAAGWVVLNRQRSAWCGRYRRFVLLALVASPFLLIPWRGVQIEDLVSRYARASSYVEQQAADVVVVDPYLIYYGQDLRRNDLFLSNAPIILALDDIPSDRLDALCRDYSVTFVSAAEARSSGIPVLSAAAAFLPEDYPDRRSRLTAPDCADSRRRIAVRNGGETP